MAQKNAEKTKQGASWVAITLLLIFFFYAGIPLMLNKLHKDKFNMVTNAKRTAAVGWIIFGLGIVYLLMGLTGGLATEDGTNVVGMVIVMVALCCGRWTAGGRSRHGWYQWYPPAWNARWQAPRRPRRKRSS